MKKTHGIFISLYCFTIQVQAQEAVGIQGDETVEIAVQGESIAHYEVPDGYRIELKEAIPGVQMDAKGTLIVSAEALPQTISLVAYGERADFSYEVKLVTSWTKQVQGAESFQIPNNEDTRKIKYMDTIYHYVPITILRLAIIIVASTILWHYRSIRRKSRR